MLSDKRRKPVTVTDILLELHLFVYETVIHTDNLSLTPSPAELT